MLQQVCLSLHQPVGIRFIDVSFTPSAPTTLCRGLLGLVGLHHQQLCHQKRRPAVGSVQHGRLLRGPLSPPSLLKLMRSHLFPH